MFNYFRISAAFWEYFTPQKMFGVSDEKYKSHLDSTFQNIFAGRMPRIIIAICVVVAIIAIASRKMSPMMIYILYTIAMVFAYGANVIAHLF